MTTREEILAAIANAIDELETARMHTTEQEWASAHSCLAFANRYILDALHQAARLRDFCLVAMGGRNAGSN
jgi:hypothetical protein